jgi:hypothetical protein
VNKQSEHLEKSTLQIPLPGALTNGVFYNDKEQGGQDRTFQFRGGLINNKHTIIYLGSGPSSEVIALCLVE